MKNDKTKNDESKIYDGDEVAIITWIPKNAFNVSYTCKFYTDDGEIHEASMTLYPDELRKARNDYLTLDPDDDAFALYCLTEHEGDNKQNDEEE